MQFLSPTSHPWSWPEWLSRHDRQGLIQLLSCHWLNWMVMTRTTNGQWYQLSMESAPMRYWTKLDHNINKSVATSSSSSKPPQNTIINSTIWLTWISLVVPVQTSLQQLSALRTSCTSPNAPRPIHLIMTKSSARIRFFFINSTDCSSVCNTPINWLVHTGLVLDNQSLAWHWCLFVLVSCFISFTFICYIKLPTRHTVSISVHVKLSVTYHIASCVTSALYRI